MMSRHGFTAVEAIAVVAILGASGAIAPVILHASRTASRDGDCRKNQGGLVQGMTSYLNDRRTYPPAYVYGAATTGPGWNINEQLPSNPNPSNGYVHWSGLMLAYGYIASEHDFACNEVPGQGAPNTNPGPNASHWEPGQVNDIGASSPSVFPNDRQAKRLAYAANAAIMPRNKFTSGMTPRTAKLFDGNPGGTGSEMVLDGAKVIAFTEWAFLSGTAPSGGWAGLATQSGVYKAHRPITPFVGISSGNDVFNEPNGSGILPRFRYPTVADIQPLSQLGPGFFPGGDVVELNAVGRHHVGGTANFAFLDQHVEQITVQESIQRRAWGDRFYTISGRNTLQP